MIIKICKKKKIPLINVVRRQEHVEILKEIGAEHIINTSEEGWEQNLKELSHKLKARVCFEAIAGETTGKILNVMPRDSVAYLFGALSQQPAGFLDPIQTIFRNKRVEGWLLI